MFTTSRRAVLAGIAAAPALTVPAVLADSTEAPSDAQLLELGNKFEAAWARALQINDQFSEIHGSILGAVKKADLHGEDVIMEAVNRMVDETGGQYEQLCDETEAAFLKCDRLAYAIAALRPTTLAGFAVRARVVMYVAPHWWRQPLEEKYTDAEYCEARSLIEALCAAGGMAEVAGRRGPLKDDELAATIIRRAASVGGPQPMRG